MAPMSVRSLRALLSRISSPRSRSQPRCGRLIRPALQLQLETLEDRTVPVAISWAINASGSWNVASNWSPQQVPGAGDDVTINVAAAITVTLDAGTRSVLTLNSQENLTVTNGASLTVTTSFILGDS